MSLDRFEWHAGKADLNFEIHGIRFENAVGIFEDLLCVTFADPAHSIEENREITIGCTLFNKVLVVSHVTRGERIRIISARLATKAERRKYMNKPHDYISDKPATDDLLPEYDFDYSKGERGKHYQGLGRLVVYVSLDPDVAERFPTQQKVNTALRQLIAEGRAPAPEIE